MSLHTEEKRSWHLGREIPLALIATLALQTLGALWWAASFAARVEANERALVVAQLGQQALDRRQDEEALRSEARVTTQLERINAKIDKLAEKPQ